MKDNLKFILLLTTALLFSSCINIQNNVKKFKYSDLHTAVRLNQIDTVKYLVKNNKNINTKDNFGDSSLIDAVRNNYTKISIILICNNANTNVVDKNNYTLIDMAIRNNNTLLVELLKDKNNSKYCIEERKKSVSKKEPLSNNIIFITSNMEYDDIIILNNTNKQKIINNESEFNKTKVTTSNENIKDSNNFKIKNEELTQFELNSYLTEKETVEINLDNKISNKQNDELKNKLIHDLSRLYQTQTTFDSKTLTFNFSTYNKLDANLKIILHNFIPELLYIVNNYKEQINEIEIKNYTSSEYRTKNTISEKFIANSILSQRRANEISTFILNISKEEHYDNEWLSSKIVTQGMSSQNLIYLIDGKEDTEKSRRTEIKIVLK